MLPSQSHFKFLNCQCLCSWPRATNNQQDFAWGIQVLLPHSFTPIQASQRVSWCLPVAKLCLVAYGQAIHHSQRSLEIGARHSRDYSPSWSRARLCGWEGRSWGLLLPGSRQYGCRSHQSPEKEHSRTFLQPVPGVAGGVDQGCRGSPAWWPAQARSP